MRASPVDHGSFAACPPRCWRRKRRCASKWSASRLTFCGQFRAPGCGASVARRLLRRATADWCSWRTPRRFNAVLRWLVDPGMSCSANHTYAACRNTATSSRRGPAHGWWSHIYLSPGAVRRRSWLRCCVAPDRRRGSRWSIMSPARGARPAACATGGRAAAPRHQDLGGTGRPAGMVPLELAKSTRPSTPATPTSGFARRRARPSCTCDATPGGATPHSDQPPIPIGISGRIRLDRHLRSDGLAVRPRSASPHGRIFAGGLAASHGGQSGPRAAAPRFVAPERQGRKSCPEAMIGSMASIHCHRPQSRLSRPRTGLQGPARLVPGTASRRVVLSRILCRCCVSRRSLPTIWINSPVRELLAAALRGQ